MMKKLLQGLLVIVAFTAIFYATLSYFSHHNLVRYANGIAKWSLYSSDAIQIPMFAHLFWYDHLKITQWMFAPSTYFVPDTLVIVLLSMVIHQPLVVIWSYALIQMIAFVIVLAYLLSSAISHRKLYKLGVISALIGLLLVARGHLGDELLQPVVMSNYHLGGTLLIFLALALLLRVYRDGRSWCRYPLILVVFLGTFSDFLFVFYFVIPVLFMMAYMYKKRQLSLVNFKFWLWLIIPATLVAQACFHLLPANFPHAHMRIHVLLYKYAWYFIQVLAIFFKNDPVVCCLWLAYMLYMPVVFKRYKQDASVSLQDPAVFLLVFIWASVLLCILGLLIIDPGLGAFVSGFTGLRHMQPLLLLPVFVGWPVYCYRHCPRFRGVLKPLWFSLVLVMIAAIAWLGKLSYDSQVLLHYYPKSIACFDRHAKALDLHQGLAGYWASKPLQLFSKAQVQVAGVETKTLAPYYWITSLRNFTLHDYRFIVVKNDFGDADIALAMLQKRFGKPQSVFTCPNNFVVNVYRSGVLRHVFNGAPPIP